MRDKKNHIYLDSHERSILLHSLVGLKNQLIQQGRYEEAALQASHTDQELLLNLLANPEMATLLKSLAKSL